jgi:hypothetical protein
VDEILVTAPRGQPRPLCHSAEHRNAGRAADVIVTFGQLGTVWPDALWPDSWGRLYPMCGPCWDTTRQVAQRARPGLIIHDTTSPAASAAGS